MVIGTKGFGMTKHGKSGTGGKGPRLRHIMRLEAERTERPDKSKLKQTFKSLRDMLKGK